MEDCKELDMTLQEATHMTRNSRVWRATKERASDGIDWTIKKKKEETLSYWQGSTFTKNKEGSASKKWENPARGAQDKIFARIIA